MQGVKKIKNKKRGTDVQANSGSGDPTEAHGPLKKKKNCSKMKGQTWPLKRALTGMPAAPARVLPVLHSAAKCMLPTAGPSGCSTVIPAAAAVAAVTVH